MRIGNFMVISCLENSKAKKIQKKKNGENLLTLLTG